MSTERSLTKFEYIQNKGLFTLYHLCKLRTFKKNTAPWLENLIEYSYLLPKYNVKISQEKKMGVFFLFHFL